MSIAFLYTGTQNYKNNPNLERSKNWMKNDCYFLTDLYPIGFLSTFSGSFINSVNAW